jgi:hypothetical protein
MGTKILEKELEPWCHFCKTWNVNEKEDKCFGKRGITLVCKNCRLAMLAILKVEHPEAYKDEEEES